MSSHTTSPVSVACLRQDEVSTADTCLVSFCVALSGDLPSSAAAVAAGQRVQLLPAGYFAAQDGRPASLTEGEVQCWRLTAQDAQALMAQWSPVNDVLIDYEHQTLLAPSNGQPAPAAGWFKQLEFIDSPSLADTTSASAALSATGLFATDVRWTPRARDMINSGEYKYISPVFTFDPSTGQVLRLIHASLTNNPALDGMGAVRAALSRFSPPPPESSQMNKLLAALGLTPAATEDSALTALATLQGRADQAQAKDAQIAALKAAQYDPAQHIPLSEHKKVADQLAALVLQTETTQHQALMTAALADARILPVNEAYWKAQPLAALSAFLKDAKPLAALTGTQTGGVAPDAKEQAQALNPVELAVCKSMGLTAAQFLAAKAAEQAKLAH